jgi:hypothetical protein
MQSQLFNWVSADNFLSTKIYHHRNSSRGYIFFFQQKFPLLKGLEHAGLEKRVIYSLEEFVVAGIDLNSRWVVQNHLLWLGKHVLDAAVGNALDVTHTQVHT